MERVEELMAKRKWVKHCLRTNCAAPEDCVMTGRIKVAKIYFGTFAGSFVWGSLSVNRGGVPVAGRAAGEWPVGRATALLACWA